MGDTQFHFRIRCSPRSCHKSRLCSQYENEVPLSYRVCLVDPYCKTTVPRSYRAVKEFLIRRLVMKSRLWNSHQRHKFLRAEASRDILKFRVSEMAFSGVFKKYFPLWMPCFSSGYTRLGIMPSKCPRHSTASHSLNVSQISTCLYMHSIILQCHSKLRNRCFTTLFDGAYFLLAVMVEGDESSRLRIAN